MKRKLTKDSGGDADSRTREAHRILFDQELRAKLAAMEANDRSFVEKVLAKCERYHQDTWISSKEIAGLRGCTEKYL